MRRALLTLAFATAILFIGQSFHLLSANAGRIQILEGPRASQNGDTNGDGNRDITDAIYFLAWLFQGGPEPVAFAGTATIDPDPYELRLVRDELKNVDDAAGRWQYSAGRVFVGRREIGRYQGVKRANWGGSDAYNAASYELTLLFPAAEAGQAPESVVLQGAHTFDSGRRSGSVSAASGRFAMYLDQPFSIDGDDILTIGD